MSENKKNWWENRVLRSVDNLKLWQDNPRLDASNRLVTVRDYVEELISDSTDKKYFVNLLTSIATRGFMSFDPVVVWQDEETKQFLVAEGNRRVMALKLLRSPDKSPLAIRKTVVKLSRMIDRDEIEKIKVCLSPSYEDARWYIIQRHSATSSEHIRWQRLQNQRFIISVYDSVGQDVEKTMSETGFTRGAIIEALRYVKIRNIATRPGITKYLTENERKEVFSHKISMTVLERWFGNSRVRDAWHISFEEGTVTINADEYSFYKAYAHFLKLMLTKNEKLGFLVNTRSIDTNFEKIFDFLPKVKSKQEAGDMPDLVGESDTILEDKSTDKPNSDNDNDNEDEAKQVVRITRKGDPKRRQFTDQFHGISCNNYKIKALFKELQKLPIRSYPTVSAASIRIFLELAVDDYIMSDELKPELCKRTGKGYHELGLNQKLKFLQNEFISERDVNKLISELLNASNDFSLNTLNEYVHGDKVHKVEPQFLNRFWDMLSPLLYVLINLQEI